MKFQFKEGQWFDVRKLTDWQKQWCLENLDWVSEESKSFINCKDLYIMYCDSHPLLKGMAGMSSEWCEPENEITFDDLYWGVFWDEDEEVSQESIFDNPRWVTCCNDSLGQVTLGKDYKVVNVNNDNYTIIMDKGIEGSLHKNRFHKVTPQDLLPEESIEGVEDSFDNLVYVEPKHIDNNTYYVVEKDKLSESQWEFLLDNIPMSHEPEGNEIYLNLDPDGRIWFGDTYKSENQDIYISFNDLFQEVE